MYSGLPNEVLWATKRNLLGLYTESSVFSDRFLRAYRRSLLGSFRRNLLDFLSEFYGLSGGIF